MTAAFLTYGTVASRAALPRANRALSFSDSAFLVGSGSLGAQEREVHRTAWKPSRGLSIG
jgi:hypothetical protein